MRPKEIKATGKPLEEEGGGTFLKGFVRLLSGLSFLRTLRILPYTFVGKSLR